MATTTNKVSAERRQGVSKAVLVLDEMPTECFKCKLCQFAFDSDLFKEGEAFCAIEIRSIEENLNNGSKPNWCPLKELKNCQTKHIMNGIVTTDNMTEQEAIKHIKYLKRLFTDTGNKINENTACDIAISALEKQIPKKVIKKIENADGFKTGYRACPNCGKWVV